MSIKLLIAEDHKLVRQGLRTLLSDQPVLQVVGEAVDGQEAIEMTMKTNPDIVLMDVSMPRLNGIEATKQITENHDDIKVIALSVHSEEQFIAGMFRAGASGYVLKDSGIAELMHAIETVNNGGMFVSKNITDEVLLSYRKRLMKDDSSLFEILTDREREVLQMIAESNTTKDIADTLSVSEKTVATHRQNIMNKLELFNIPDLVKFAIRHGLTSLE